MSEGLLIDFNAHILPETVENKSFLWPLADSLDNLRDCGIGAVVLAPEYDPDKEDIKSAVKRRDKTICDNISDLRKDGRSIYFGFEVGLSEKLLTMPDADKLKIEGTDTIIIRMPDGVWTDGHFNVLSAMRNEGYRIVISHINKYRKKSAEEIFRLGFACQADISAFDSFITPKLWKGKKKRLLKAIDEGHIVAIGSGFHGNDRRLIRSAENLSRALKREKEYALCRAAAKYLDGAIPVSAAFRSVSAR